MQRNLTRGGTTRARFKVPPPGHSVIAPRSAAAPIHSPSTADVSVQTRVLQDNPRAAPACTAPPQLPNPSSRPKMVEASTGPSLGVPQRSLNSPSSGDCLGAPRLSNAVDGVKPTPSAPSAPTSGAQSPYRTKAPPQVASIVRPEVTHPSGGTVDPKRTTGKQPLLRRNQVNHSAEARRAHELTFFSRLHAVRARVHGRPFTCWRGREQVNDNALVDAPPPAGGTAEGTNSGRTQGAEVVMCAASASVLPPSHSPPSSRMLDADEHLREGSTDKSQLSARCGASNSGNAKCDELRRPVQGHRNSGLHFQLIMKVCRVAF